MPATAWLGIDGALAVTLSFSRAATLAGHRLRSIKLAPAPSASPDGWCAGASLPAGQMQFEREGGAVRLAWPDNTPLALLRSDGAAELSGRLALSVGQVVALLCEKVRTRREAAVTSTTVWMREGHARLGKLHVLLGRGQEPGTFEATGTALTRLHLPEPHTEVALMVPDADLARLSFDEGSMQLIQWLRPVNGTKQAVASPDTIPLDKPHLHLSLGHARLRLRRGADLLDLGFRFRNMLLQDTVPPSLIRIEKAKAHLLVDFPPQHVMEEAFLRQEVVLPDVGPAVTAAERRIIAGDGDAAKAKRREIHDSKIAVADPDVAAFTAFATEWGNPLWVGPAGLFRIADRQRARKLVLKLAREARTNAKAKLAGIAPTEADIVEGIRSAPLPTLSIDGTVLAAIAAQGRDAVHAYFRLQDVDYAAVTEAGKPVFWQSGAYGWPLSPAQAALAKVEQKATTREMADFIGTVIAAREAAEQKVLTPPVNARLAGTTRLAFEIKASELPLTTARLTTWTSKDFVAQSVTRRARRVGPEATPAQELEAQGISPHEGGTTPDQRMAAVFDALVPPSETETSIELPARLILSPAADGTWVTPPPLTRSGARLPQRHLIWSAWLHEKTPSLRAVWSDDFDPAAFANGKPVPPERAVKPPLGSFRTALDAADRHELVALSSVPGLPVIGLPQAGGGGPRRESSFLRPPEGYALTGIDDPDGQSIYIPKTLEVQQLALSALGATFSAATGFSPPASVLREGKAEHLFRTLSVERWNAEIVDGADVVTTIVRRGYLFPFGHLASLVKETAPRLRWTIAGYVWEQATRIYVTRGRESQAYPAPGQPDVGRAAAMRSVELRTSRTSDLVDPGQAPPLGPDKPIGTDIRGRVSGGGIEGLVFWPRTQLGETGTFPFRLSVNGKRAVVRMPLLFLDNAAANSQATLRALCAWYGVAGAEKPQNWSTMRHNGTELAYAPERKEGDTTLATNWQRWRVAGRSAGRDEFAFDAALQAAEQPPFYPVLDEAEVTSRQIQGLTGAGPDPFRIRLRGAYVGNGFPQQKKTSDDEETFLELVGDEATLPRLGMGDNGDRAGGVARPAMTIRGWNRAKGPVGGLGAASELQAATPSIATAPAPAVVLAPSKNILDSISDVKLLGLVSVRDFVKLLAASAQEAATPALQEVVEYSAAAGVGIDGLLKKLYGAARDALMKIAELFGTQQAAQAALPDVVDALTAVQAAAKKTAPKPADLAELWSAAQALLRAVDRVLAAPVSAAADAARSLLLSLVSKADLAAAWNMIIAEARLFLASQAASLLAPVLLRLPPLAPNLLQAGEDALRRAAADPATWQADDPWGRILARLQADPTVGAALRVATREQIVGPLADQLRPLLAGLRQSGTQGLEALVNAIDNWRKALEPLAADLDALAGNASRFCTAAVAQAQQLVTAALPDLGRTTGIYLSRPPGRVAYDAMVAAGITLRQKHDVLVPLLPGHAAAVLQLATAIETWGGDFGARLDEYDRARRAAPGLPATCAALADGKTGSAVRWQMAARQDLDRSALVPAGLAALASSIATLPQPSGSAAAAAWTEAARALGQAAAPVLQIPTAESLLGPAAAAARTAISAALQTPPPHTAAGLANRLDALADQARRAIDAAAALPTAARLTATASTVNVTLTQLLAASGAGQVVVQSWNDETMRGALLEAALLSAFAEQAGAARAALGSFAGVVLKPAYSTLREARDAALKAAEAQDIIATKLFGPPPDRDGCGGTWSKAIFLLPTATGVCTTDGDALATEAGQSAGEIARLWRDRKAAPQLLVDHAAKIAEYAAHAAIVRLLDLDSLKDALVGAINNLVPLNTRLTNTLNVPLRKLDLFGIIQFTPIAVEPQLHLSSTFVAGVAIGTGEPKATITSTIEGRVPHFSIEIIEVLKVEFRKGIIYTAGTGRSGKLEAPIGAEDVTFGPILKFLEQLASSLTMGSPGQGPYSRILLDRPALEAGYALAIPVIMMGVTFSNVNLLASIVLPFDAREARIRLALSSFALPFTISAGIYGGGGFFGCELSARGIELFEASFQFGAVVAIGYGPLNGIGYVLTGAYIRKDANGCAFSLLFVAGFSAHIACFAISASFTLRLGTPSGGGGLEGEAILVFTFKVGFLSYSYSVRVHRKIDQGFKDAGAGAKDTGALDPPLSRTMLASAGTTYPTGQPSPVAPQTAQLITQTPPPIEHEQWKAYAMQFDDSFRPMEPGW